MEIYGKINSYWPITSKPLCVHFYYLFWTLLILIYHYPWFLMTLLVCILRQAQDHLAVHSRWWEIRLIYGVGSVIKETVQECSQVLSLLSASRVDSLVTGRVTHRIGNGGDASSVRGYFRKGSQSVPISPSLWSLLLKFPARSLLRRRFRRNGQFLLRFQVKKKRASVWATWGNIRHLYGTKQKHSLTQTCSAALNFGICLRSDLLIL